VKEIGQKAIDVVRREQGATMRHARVIFQILCTKRGEEFQRPAAPPQSIAQPMQPAPPAANIPPPPPIEVPPQTEGIPGVTPDAVTQSPAWLVIRPIRKP
jgi:hypothetical protein